jgi:hypothetical protein
MPPVVGKEVPTLTLNVPIRQATVKRQVTIFSKESKPDFANISDVNSARD